jgi:hypothetical protein
MSLSSLESTMTTWIDAVAKNVNSSAKEWLEQATLNQNTMKEKTAISKDTVVVPFAKPVITFRMERENHHSLTRRNSAVTITPMPLITQVIAPTVVAVGLALLTLVVPLTPSAHVRKIQGNRKMRLEIGKPNKRCPQIFRYRENNFVSKGRIVFSREWRFMKSLSCKGDHEANVRCYNPIEDAEDGGLENAQINYPEKPIDGQLYQAVFIPTGIDFETGYVDDWIWEMVPFNPEEETQ